jgi:hypothetical protein
MMSASLSDTCLVSGDERVPSLVSNPVTGLHNLNATLMRPRHGAGGGEVHPSLNRQVTNVERVEDAVVVVTGPVLSVTLQPVQNRHTVRVLLLVKEEEGSSDGVVTTVKVREHTVVVHGEPVKADRELSRSGTDKEVLIVTTGRAEGSVHKNRILLRHERLLLSLCGKSLFRNVAQLMLGCQTPVRRCSSHSSSSAFFAAATC